ncbi:MAG: hypothetical protein ACPL1G_03110 [Thermodesulfovibrionales bacterium]
MAKVKSAFEKAMEKIASLGELSQEEKEKIKEQEKIRTILAEYYKRQIDKDALWERLKGSKPSLLKEAQQYLIDSIGLGDAPEEFQLRKDGIIAIENLKDKKNISAIEHVLNSIKTIQKEYAQGKERAEEELREAIETNPQLRIQPMRTPDGRTVYQAAVSVDEAVQARLSEFLSEHEKVYSMQFNKLIEKLRKEVNR